MAILDILSEQAAFGFTGKINILVRSNGQYLGAIFQSEGNIVDATIEHLKGKKALFRIIFLDVETNNYLTFVVEPEIIKEENFNVKINFDDLKKEAQASFQNYLNAKKLKPPLGLKLLIDPEIIVNNDQISANEFDVLSLLTDWSKVEDIYKYSKLLEFEVTHALVSLRKKKAIKVFQS